MKLPITAAAAILSCAHLKQSAAAAQDWPPSDVCGDDMDLFGTNINGVNCAYCASPSPDCAVACTGSGVCLCGDDPNTSTGGVDMASCCVDNPCCTDCPDPKPQRCSVNYCSAEPSDCATTVCPDPQPPSGYVQIRGRTSSSSGSVSTKMCWELRNGQTKAENKIVLDKCQHKKNAQKFKLSAVPVNNVQREGLSFMVHPKLDPSKVVVGVRVAAEKGWLRVEEPNEARTETQSFTALDSGLVRLGTHSLGMAAADYLFVTNQGLKANKGDAVMLTTGSRLQRFEKQGEGIIVSWEFV